MLVCPCVNGPGTKLATMAWKPAKHGMFGDTVYISVGDPYIANKKGGSEPAARCTEQGWRPRWLPFVFSWAPTARSERASGALCAAARARARREAPRDALAPRRGIVPSVLFALAPTHTRTRAAAQRKMTRGSRASGSSRRSRRSVARPPTTGGRRSTLTNRSSTCVRPSCFHFTANRPSATHVPGPPVRCCTVDAGCAASCRATRWAPRSRTLRPGSLR